MTTSTQVEHSRGNTPSPSAWRQIEKPLAGIVGLAELLRDRGREASAAARNEIIDQLAMRAQTVRHVVDNVLLSVRLADGDIDFRADSVPLRSLVESVALDWTTAHGARVTVTGDVEAIGDAEWIAVAVRNVLEDANGRGARSLDVRLFEGYSQVTIQVDDDGAVVPDDELESFDTPFRHRQAADWDGSVLSVGVVTARGLMRGMGGDMRLFPSSDVNTCELTLHRSQETSPDRRGQIPTRALFPRDNQPTTEDVLTLLDESSISMVYQSIVDLRAGAGETPHVIGYEAFARFPFASPPAWFKLAGSAGMGTDLELLALRVGIEGFVTRHEEAFLALNLSNATLLTPHLTRALEGIDPGRLVLELSDTARIHSYEVTRRAVDSLRERGIRLAVDDIGAGEIDMWHILRLNPEILKLDRHLVADQENARRNDALIRGLATMAGDLGIAVIAEAIETEAERLRLLGLGVELGQGFLFGEPEALKWQTRVLGD